MYYDPFYRIAGIRRAEQLLKPPMLLTERLELPRNSIYHYLSTASSDVGPSSNEHLFRNIVRPILTAHILENGDMLGTPRRLNIQPAELVRTFHGKPNNRRFKRMHDLESAQRDEATLILYNYGFIQSLYHYPRTFYSEYYRWWNIQSALWKNIGAISAVSQRQHFVKCELPLILPTLADLRIGCGGISQKMMHIFNTPESLMILELWKWFGEERSASVLGKLTQPQLDKVNLIFTESGRWFVMNLGLLNGWRQATEEELAANKEANQKGIKPHELQLRFLRLMMSLFEVRTVSGPEVIAEADKAPAGSSLEKPITENKTTVLPVMNRETGVIEMKPVVKPGKKIEIDQTLGETHTGDDIKHDEALHQKMLADLSRLEFLSQAAQAAADEQVIHDIEEEETYTPETGVKKVCDRLAEDGLLSGAAYERYITLSQSYKTMPSPVKNQTMEEFMKIDPASVRIDKSPSIPDIPTVFDKTMLASSLHVMHSNYTKNVMQKDVANMVMSLQNAGIAVTSYEVEEVEDIVGAYRDYTVKTVPVDGSTSTLRFKLPIIDDEGVYRANGVNYRLRMQDTDLPIRKIGPDCVSLTSYYGKTFISRSEKRVNDYGTWLRNAILAKGLDDTNNDIQDMHTYNVFDNQFVCPRLYSTMAMGFRSFRIAGFETSFDHTKRVALYGEPALALYEKDGAIVAGKNKAGEFLVIGKDSVLYRGAGGVLTDLGTIEAVAHLDADKAPVDFAELKVFKRSVPIGFVLGYEIGLDKLMRLLRVKPRRVNAGSRVNLLPNEYSLVFSDETLVFNREDKTASLVLSGFNEYHKAIRQYSVYEFDRKGVYLNVLEDGGNSVRFLREIDLMYQMFIDPITKELLVEMNEPTTFRGLLLRSCELILTDYHPDESDTAFMRKRGYERMAGAVYSQLVQSIRGHNGRPGKSKMPIDLNPYAVWTSIAQDPSNALTSEINPIQNLKEAESLTFSGVGGRNSRSMTKHTRAYHPNSMGTTSESTVDSSDVAINTYTSADPQFTSVRGISRRYKVGETGITALLSTSALLAPSSDIDD